MQYIFLSVLCAKKQTEEVIHGLLMLCGAEPLFISV